MYFKYFTSYCLRKQLNVHNHSTEWNNEEFYFFYFHISIILWTINISLLFKTVKEMYRYTVSGNNMTITHWRPIVYTLLVLFLLNCFSIAVCEIAIPQYISILAMAIKYVFRYTLLLRHTQQHHNPFFTLHSNLMRSNHRF